ncbi:Mitochondrial ribosome-associated GTPase 1, partial [Fragariocoptes setiger]
PVCIFRHTFSVEMAQASKKFVNWYPGHMYKGMQAMMGKLSRVDCVVEVHDARIPITGRNEELKRLLGSVKPHVLVLNKRDLADLSHWKQMKQLLHQRGDKNILLTDLSASQYTVKSRGYTDLAQMVINSIKLSDRYNREDVFGYKIMIVGIPNVGKSSLINRLRQYHAGLSGEPAMTGPQAGVTRHVMQTIKICNRPPIYVIDTPGILAPAQTTSKEDVMKLALCATISDKIVSNMDLSEYLLKWLNKRHIHTYLPHMNLTQPVHTLDELLIKGAIALNMTKTSRDPITRHETLLPDVERVASHFIKTFRYGLFGHVMMNNFYSAMNFFEEWSKRWVCPSDRELTLRAKLNSGWSSRTHADTTPTINESEQAIIARVLQRANQVNEVEQARVKQLTDKLENIKKAARGNGKRSCILCDEQQGLFHRFRRCKDCESAVCNKCSVDLYCADSDESILLCKICWEAREVVKKANLWTQFCPANR